MSSETRTQARLLPQLQSHREQLGTITYEAQALAGDLSEDQWHWSPAPGEWSIAQCLDHLNVTHGLLLPRFEAAIRQARAQGWYSSGPFSYNLVERLFIRALEPTAPVQQPAPRIYRPAPRPVTPDVLPRFLVVQEGLIGCVEAANGLDLKRARVTSPVTWLLRLSLAAWFQATVGHTWNHLQQAQRVRADARFP